MQAALVDQPDRDSRRDRGSVPIDPDSRAKFGRGRATDDEKSGGFTSMSEPIAHSRCGEA